jgi:hypothetical protein
VRRPGCDVEDHVDVRIARARLAAQSRRGAVRSCRPGAGSAGSRSGPRGQRGRAAAGSGSAPQDTWSRYAAGTRGWRGDRCPSWCPCSFRSRCSRARGRTSRSRRALGCPRRGRRGRP